MSGADFRAKRLVAKPRLLGFFSGHGPHLCDEVVLESNPQNILFVRTDSIGDALLASGMLPVLRDRYPRSHITVLCQPHLEAIYQRNPAVDATLLVDKATYLKSADYRRAINRQMKAARFDLALNSVFSREPITDELTLASGATLRIAFTGNHSNISPKKEALYNWGYTHLLASGDQDLPELLRHQEFLTRLGFPPQSIRPQIHLQEQDHLWASDLFEQVAVDPARTIALFAGVQHSVRRYLGYGEALKRIVNDYGLNVIALGAEADREINDLNLRPLSNRTINLSGATSLTQSAALLRRCMLAVGGETGLAHMACAVGTPNVILLGGGHFGRFMPYSSLTSIVSLPLECYGCNWSCRYDKPHCVQNVAPELLERAILEAMEGRSSRCRVYLQGQDTLEPRWVDPSHWFRPWGFDIKSHAALASGSFNKIEIAIS